MLTLKILQEEPGYIEEVRRLYNSAFPENERRPFDEVLRMDEKDDDGKIAVFLLDNVFCGFGCLLTRGSITHLLYFAVEDRFRNRGYGSQILRELKALVGENKLVVDIESDKIEAENIEQRRRRKMFYIRNGFAETGVGYSWRGETYELLSAGGIVTDEEEKEFWGGD